MKMLLSLVVWAVLWEIAGRLKLSTITLRSFGLGMLLALVIGIPLGVVMARVKGIGRLLGMWVDILVSAPISALVPILMAVVGITHAERSLVEMARSFGASRRRAYGSVRSAA